MPQVNIHITETAKKLEIITNPPCLQMPKNSPTQTITFKLNSRDYSFPADPAEAIKFKNHGNQIGPSRSGIVPDSVLVADSNTDKDYYEYTVKVVRNDGKVLIIDPLIKNN